MVTILQCDWSTILPPQWKKSVERALYEQTREAPARGDITQQRKLNQCRFYCRPCKDIHPLEGGHVCVTCKAKMCRQWWSRVVSPRTHPCMQCTGDVVIEARLMNDYPLPHLQRLLRSMRGGVRTPRIWAYAANGNTARTRRARRTIPSHRSRVRRQPRRRRRR